LGTSNYSSIALLRINSKQPERVSGFIKVGSEAKIDVGIKQNPGYWNSFI
jgi:hypothetical protein